MQETIPAFRLPFSEVVYGRAAFFVAQRRYLVFDNDYLPISLIIEQITEQGGKLFSLQKHLVRLEGLALNRKVPQVDIPMQ